MEKIKQIKNNSAVYRVASAALAAFFLFCSLTVPSFAAVSSTVSDYSLQPIPTFTTSGVFNSWDNYLLAVEESYAANNDPWFNRYIWSATPGVDVYAFAVEGSSTQIIYFLSESEFSYGYSTRYQGTSATGNGSVSTLSFIPDDTHPFYWHSYSYNDGNTGYNQIFHVPIYSTYDAGVLALQDHLANAGLSDPAPINLTVNPGYVAFIDITGLSDIQASVQASSAVALSPSQWASTNILYGYVDSIPSSFSLPLSGSTSFSWRSGKTNIYGKSQSWSWLGRFTGGHKYLFISNPTYSNLYGLQSNGSSMILDNPSATNSPVSVYLAQARDIKLVSLKATITYDPSVGDYGGVDDGNGEDSYSVGYDPSTGQWVTTNDTTGEPVGPEGVPIGGDNSLETPSEFTTIASWLENIAHQIGSFFTGAIGAVSTLVSAGSAFIRQLISLYSWLPAPVYAVLSSALILVITIGVIKVFI